MILKKCILTANDCYKSGNMMSGKATGIVLHSTGCNNKTLKRYVQPRITDKDYESIIADLGKNIYNNHWNNSGLTVCVHAFIGENVKGEVETYQTLPFDMCCWGCAAAPYDKYGNKLYSYKDSRFDHYGPSYNYNPQARVQVEICEDGLTDRGYFDRAFKEAAEFCAYICKENGLTSKDICSHYEGYKKGYASNHGDCDHWLKKFGKDMNWFRGEVDKLLLEDKKSQEEKAPAKLAFYVQTGAYLSLKNATVQYKKVIDAGFPAQIKKDGSIYRVHTGDYEERTKAVAMAKRMQEKGFKTSISMAGGTVVSPEEDVKISVGDKVKIKEGVTKFTNGVNMLSFVKTATLYVRQIEKNGTVYLVSTLPSGNIYTGRVFAADVEKIQGE